MLDGLLGRGGFSSKCKSLIKPTKTRIEVLRRRAEATQRFLKEDLVKLLSNGLDINAYGRTEEFLAGLNLLSCYSFLEQACEYVYKQLSVMQKLRECPEEYREPVASLMFAAARFSDLPELRDLRDLFQDKYGNSLECFANQVFVEKLASKPPTMEKRLQLLQDIASEYSIKWDSKAFQQRLANPSLPAQDKSIKHGPLAATDGKYKLPNNMNATSQANNKLSVRSKERFENSTHGPTLENVRENTVLRREGSNIPYVGKQEVTCHTPKQVTVKAETSLKGENHEIPFRGRPGFIAEKYGSSRGKDDNALKMEIRGKDDNALKMEISGSSSSSRRPEYFFGHMVISDQKHENVNIASSTRLTVDSNGKGSCVNNLSQQKSVKSTEKVQDEGTDKLKSSYNSALPPPYVKLKDNPVPPPYVKPNENGYRAHHRSKHSSLDSMDSSHRIQTKSSVSSDRVSKSPDHNYYKEDGSEKDRDYCSHGGQKGSKHATFGSDGSSMDPSPHIRDIQKEPDISHSDELDDAEYQNDRNNIPLPKPRSIRRKHLKSSSSSRHDEMRSVEGSRIVRRISSSKRKERKGLQILFDDDHYKKDDEEKMMDKLLLHYSKKSSTYDIEKLRKKPPSSGSGSSHMRSRDGSDETPELIIPLNRSRSLPREQSGESELQKVFTRANSFQPDNQAKHVHPKLPDYDDLAARFAALKGR